MWDDDDDALFEAVGADLEAVVEQAERQARDRRAQSALTHASSGPPPPRRQAAPGDGRGVNASNAPFERPRSASERGPPSVPVPPPVGAPPPPLGAGSAGFAAAGPTGASGTPSRFASFDRPRPAAASAGGIPSAPSVGGPGRSGGSGGSALRSLFMTARAGAAAGAAAKGAGGSAGGCDGGGRGAGGGAGAGGWDGGGRGAGGGAGGWDGGGRGAGGGAGGWDGGGRGAGGGAGGWDGGGRGAGPAGDRWGAPGPARPMPAPGPAPTPGPGPMSAPGAGPPVETPPAPPPALFERFRARPDLQVPASEHGPGGASREPPAPPQVPPQAVQRTPQGARAAPPSSFSPSPYAPSSASTPSPSVAPFSASHASPIPVPTLYGHFELSRGGRFLELRLGHHDGAAAALRSVPGVEYSSTGRFWRVPLDAVEEVHDAVANAQGCRVRLEPPPSVAAAAALAALRLGDDSDRYAAIPETLERSLMPFQREGVKFALARAGRAILGDEMGLGKTVQALAVASAYRDEWPVLVVAPASLREAWADACHRWLGVTGDRIGVVHTTKDAEAWGVNGNGAGVGADPPGVAKGRGAGGRGKKGAAGGPGAGGAPPSAARAGGGAPGAAAGRGAASRASASSAASSSSSSRLPPASWRFPALDVLIVSYNFVPRMALSDVRWGVAIADEAHYIKDPKAQRSKAVIPVLQSARRALLLSGTPALNRPKELFPLLSSALPSANLRMSEFGERFCPGTRWDRYGGAANLPELHALLSCVMARRLKKDVLPQLPAKRRQQVLLALDAHARKELARLQSKLEDAGKALAEAVRRAEASASAGAGAGGLRFGEDGGVIMELYRKSAELKAPAVQEYVRTMLESGEKFLIFGHHMHLLDAIEQEVRKGGRGGRAPGASGSPPSGGAASARGARFIRITGSTPPRERQQLVDLFQSDPDVRCAILSIKAAGVGLTMTAASTVVFAELTWTPGEIIQAEDRAHRIGQASSVNVSFLHAKGSIDDVIWSCVQNKLENLGEAVDGRGAAIDVEGGVRKQMERGQMRIQSFANATKPKDEWGAGGGAPGPLAAWGPGADQGGRAAQPSLAANRGGAGHNRPALAAGGRLSPAPSGASFVAGNAPPSAPNRTSPAAGGGPSPALNASSFATKAPPGPAPRLLAAGASPGPKPSGRLTPGLIDRTRARPWEGGAFAKPPNGVGDARAGPSGAGGASARPHAAPNRVPQRVAAEIEYLLSDDDLDFDDDDWTSPAKRVKA